MAKDIILESNSITMSPIQLFNNLSNEDLLDIADAGELNNFCKALTLDILTENEKDTTYKA